MALSVCSCANPDELAKTRAELEEARKENAELRAQLEKLGVQPTRPNAKAPDAKVEAEVMKRWNAVAETMPAELLAFLQNEENIKYLADNGYFTAELRYVLPSGQVTKMGTFAKLAEQFSAPDALGKLDEPSQKALKAISDRIQASVRNAGKV